jgi:hypothetical protein
MPNSKARTTYALALEQRRTERYACSDAPMVRVLTKPSFQAAEAVVCDVSVAGLGLALSRPLEPGIVLAIQLQRRRIGMSGILSGRVMYCVEQYHRTWRVGCALSRHLTEDEIGILR